MKLSLLFRTALIWACVLTANGVQATVDKVELEGNLVKETTLDDWQNINLGISMADVTTGVISDLPPQTIFWKGGSKDTEDVTKWWYTDGSVPDKDDLRNGYAAAYFIDNGVSDDLVFYFGAERYANNGDAIMGFWFFQDKVGPGPNNRFTGQHQENDLFIIMEYPQGSNSAPFVQVMRWVNSGGDVDEHLELIYTSGDNGAKCLSADDTGIACAITNNNPELAGVANGLWPYDNKAGIANTYPQESFFEGRLNVTQAFLAAGVTEIPCFSSFLIETRSSRSETAQLKDFLGGEFPLCSIAITKTCSATQLANSNQFLIEYSLNLTNTGVGSIDAGETVTINDAPSDGTAFDIIQALSAFTGGEDGWAPNEMLTYSGSYISTVNGGTNTVDASVSFGSSSITATQYTATCGSLALSPMLTIAGNCSMSLAENGGLIALRRDYDISVCNSGDVPLDVTLAGLLGGSPTAMFSLDFAKQCDNNSDCGDGYSCVSNMCTNTDGEREGYFGGEVCRVTQNGYFPSVLPDGTFGTLANVVTATATSTLVDTGLLGSVGNSDTPSCDLCPLFVPTVPE